MTEKDVTPAVKASVRAYLLARVYHETMREKVNEVYNAILTEMPIYSDRHDGEDGKQIFDPSKMYLTKDDEACKRIYAEANVRLRAAGLKPDSMGDDYCPALVAGSVQTKAEHVVIEAAAEMMGRDDPEKFGNSLICLGLEKYHKFIDLVVGLVVNLPDFKAPNLKTA